MNTGPPPARRMPLAGIVALRLLVLTCALGAERAAGAAAAAGDPVQLVNFTAEFDLSAIGRSDAQLALVSGPSGPALRVTTGRAAPWPGVTLKAKAGTWDLSRRTYLSVTVHSVGARPLRVHCRVDNAGADGVKNCLTESTDHLNLMASNQPVEIREWLRQIELWHRRLEPKMPDIDLFVRDTFRRLS